MIEHWGFVFFRIWGDGLVKSWAKRINIIPLINICQFVLVVFIPLWLTFKIVLVVQPTTDC